MGFAKDVRGQKFDEAQWLAEVLLDAETKMGQLLHGVAYPTASRAGSRHIEIIGVV